MPTDTSSRTKESQLGTSAAGRKNKQQYGTISIYQCMDLTPFSFEFIAGQDEVSDKALGLSAITQ